MARNIVLTALLALSLGAGCGVKKETHGKVLDELATCQGELQASRSKVDEQGTRITQLESELSTTRAERDQMTEAEREKQARIAKLLDEMQAGEKELLDLRRQRDMAQARLESYRQLQAKLKELVDTGKLDVEFRSGQMVLKLPSGVLFGSGRADLSREGKTALAEVLDILVEFKDRRFMVAGHTDNVKIRSRKFKSNWELSTARALSVLEAMVEKGFAPENVSAAGYGEFQPVADNETDEGRQLNRRIEIILVPDLSELPNLTEEPS